MSSFEIFHPKRVLPNERFPFVLQVNDSSLNEIKISLDEGLKMNRALNYDLEKIKKEKDMLRFSIPHFQFENNLALELITEKTENTKSVGISIKGIGNNNDEILSYRTTLVVLVPQIEVHSEIIEEEQKQEQYLHIEMKNRDKNISVFFDQFLISAREKESNEIVKIDIVNMDEFEYLKKLEDIPPLFTPDNLIKEILIHTLNSCVLSVQAQYHDLKGNIYRSNHSEVTCKPLASKILQPKSETKITLEFPKLIEGFEVVETPEISILA